MRAVATRPEFVKVCGVTFSVQIDWQAKNVPDHFDLHRIADDTERDHPTLQHRKTRGGWKVSVSSDRTRPAHS